MRESQNGGEMNLKYCSTCARFQPETKFHRNKYMPDGLGYKCMTYCAKLSRAYYIKNKDKINNSAKKYYRDRVSA